MKQSIILAALMTTALITSGCGPSARKHTLSERRQIVDDMANQNLLRLYDIQPMAQQEVAESVGYAVFSNAGIHVIFFGGGGGYGVVFDKQTGRKTYMQVSSGSAGFGIGAKDYRQVIIFRTREAMNNFVGGGWGVAGQADATAKTTKTGGQVAAEGMVGKDVKVYTMTETGLALQATVSGTRYWVDDDLNRPTL